MPNYPGQFINQEVEVGTSIYRWNGTKWELYGYVFGSKPKPKNNVIWWTVSILLVLIVAYFLFRKRGK